VNVLLKAFVHWSDCTRLVAGRHRGRRGAFAFGEGDRNGCWRNSFGLGMAWSVQLMTYVRVIPWRRPAPIQFTDPLTNR
jgi:hypothetical protein